MSPKAKQQQESTAYKKTTTALPLCPSSQHKLFFRAPFFWGGGTFCPPLPLTFSALPSFYNLPKKTMTVLQYARIFRKIHLPNSPKLFFRAAGKISNLFPIIADFIWAMNVVSNSSTRCWKRWKISKTCSGSISQSAWSSRLFFCSNPSATSFPRDICSWILFTNYTCQIQTEPANKVRQEKDLIRSWDCFSLNPVTTLFLGFFSAQ